MFDAVATDTETELVAHRNKYISVVLVCMSRPQQQKTTSTHPIFSAVRCFTKRILVSWHKPARCNDAFDRRLRRLPVGNGELGLTLSPEGRVLTTRGKIRNKCGSRDPQLKDRLIETRTRSGAYTYAASCWKYGSPTAPNSGPPNAYTIYAAAVVQRSAAAALSVGPAAVAKAQRAACVNRPS
ncbi:hypothetical protein Tcan_11156 [Toxocara canis]|uniref:Uncharacterized protein n=2 Tax=Toxocara canis TaxID=6265 RepID=A0A0B2VC94_TOXCA|nr:hypothetical protein Tcan_11156 [Toxocara canis]VDM39125.1 unnamed protein product [Toxocara canis]